MDERMPAVEADEFQMRDTAAGDSVELSLKGIITESRDGAVTIRLANNRVIELTASDVSSMGVIEPDYSAGSVYLSADGNNYLCAADGWTAFDGNTYPADFPMRPLRLLAPVS